MKKPIYYVHTSNNLLCSVHHSVHLLTFSIKCANLVSPLVFSSNVQTSNVWDPMCIRVNEYIKVDYVICLV